MSDEPKRYSVNTLAEMAAIPTEAWPRFLAELPALLAMERARQDTNAAEGRDVLARRGAVWVDDGRKDVVRVRIHKHTPPTVGDWP